MRLDTFRRMDLFDHRIRQLERTEQAGGGEPGPAGPPGATGPAGPQGPAGGTAGHASFMFSSSTTEPPTGTQLRLNNATQSSATKLWVMDTDVDGLDVTIGLARIMIGHQVYLQDFDDATRWIKFSVIADAIDKGNYFEIGVAHHSGSAASPLPIQKIEFQALAPGQVGVPPGGTTGQMLTKDSATDWDVSWVTGTGGTLGYAQVVASQTGITTLADLTGLSVTVTVAAGRRIRITGQARLSIDASITNRHVPRGYIREGSTTLGLFGDWNVEGVTFAGARNELRTGSIILTPSPGSHTYKLSLERAAGTAATVGITAAADSPAFILVEDIGV